MSLCVLVSYFAVNQRSQSVAVSQSSSQDSDAKTQSITLEEGQPEWTQPPPASILILIILESVHVL